MSELYSWPAVQFTQNPLVLSHSEQVSSVQLSHYAFGPPNVWVFTGHSVLFSILVLYTLPAVQYVQNPLYLSQSEKALSTHLSHSAFGSSNE